MEQEERIANENWQAPPPPPGLPQETGPTMSEPQTLTSIFFEPGRTFESLRIKPKFLMATIISILVMTAFNFLFIQKVGFERIIQEQNKLNPQMEQMDPAQKAQILAFQTSPVMKGFTYAAPALVITIMFLLGGLIYWGANAAFGSSAGFLRSLSIFVYSSYPYYLIAMILNIVVLLIQSVDNIDVVRAQRGLIQTNLGFLVDPKTSPALNSFLSSFDLLWFYGLFLASLGFQKVARLSSSSAWTIVIISWVVFVVFRLAYSIATGVAM